MNLEVYGNIPFDKEERNAFSLIGRNFIILQVNDQKHADKKDLFRTGQVSHQTLIQLSLLFTSWREIKGGIPQNKQQLKVAALKPLKSITKEERNSLVMSAGSLA